jgi:hypothetical protein
MRFISNSKRHDGFCAEGEYCVQICTKGAMLVKEFCLPMQANNIPNIEAAEELVRTTLAPCDFAALSVTLVSGEGTEDQNILQFELQHDGAQSAASSAIEELAEPDT